MQRSIGRLSLLNRHSELHPNSTFLLYHHPLLLSNSSANAVIIKICQPKLYSNAPQRNEDGFFGKFLKNLQQEYEKNKEMKENVKRFREKRKELEESDVLKKAREKFEAIGQETTASSQISQKYSELKDKVNETLEEAKKSELGKKAGEVTDEFEKAAKQMKESVGNIAKQLDESQTVNVVKKGVQTIREEVVDSTLGGPTLYRPPVKLRMRKEHSIFSDDRPVEPNTDATGVELHKDSKWHKSWEEFKNNNTYVNKLFELKSKFDESDNPMVRASKLVTEKFSDLFGGLFSSTQLSDVLTEICKADPDFDKNEFVRFCETDVIPNILEAIARGDLEVLEDWTHEAVYTALSQPIKQAKERNLVCASRILDIENVELVLGNIIDQGPVLAITFQAQQIFAYKDKQGNLVEGNLDKIHRVHYVWALCRDMNEFDPRAAWRLVEFQAQATEQWL